MLSLQSCTTPQQYPITEDGVGDENLRFHFCIPGMGRVEGNLGFLKKLTGKTWCPVGVGYNQTGFLFQKTPSFWVWMWLWIGWGLYDHYHDWIELMSGNDNGRSHDVYLDASIENPEDCSPSVVPDDYREP